MENTPKTELVERITRFQTYLAAHDLDGALILQNADLFYFSGTVQQSLLYIPAGGEPVLLVRKALERARRESALDLVVPLSSTRQLIDVLAAHRLPRPRRLGMELDVLPVLTYRYYERLLDGVELLDCSLGIRELRAVKSAYELELLQRAATDSEPIYRSIPDLLRPGITELELAAQVEMVTRRLGHQGIVRIRAWNNDIFYGHLLAGASAAVPSYLSSPTGGTGLTPAFAQGASRHAIQAGEPVLVDYLFAPDGYIVDQTRIFAVNSLPADLFRAHEAMLAVQAAVMAAARPGVTGDELWQLAVDTAAGWGLADHFMGDGPDGVTFVGHGVGLELDEWPVLAVRQKLPLQVGMVVALEPKAIFAGRGVVGIENTHVVTQTGLERLTHLPDQIVVV